ncbi:MAG: hypothetical protein M1823_004398 [Watsoniomyces obsoletus]|nr:MAG: hypothetical protein M1823_004398 [Watsoniomyces obsoletus]
MPSTWSLQDNYKLLLAIVELNNVKTASWPIIAQKMGGSYTAEACRQHYNKIKRDTASGKGESSANSSPEKPKPAAPGTGRKRKAAEAEVDDDAQVAVTNGRSTRVKKERTPKKERTQSAAVFKAEPAEGELVDVDADDALYDEDAPDSDD